MSVPVQFIKVYATCDSKTGQVEIVWLENTEPVNGFLGKEVLASGSTKNVYQVSEMTIIVHVIMTESHLLAFNGHSFLLVRGSLRLVLIVRLHLLRMRNI